MKISFRETFSLGFNLLKKNYIFIVFLWITNAAFAFVLSAPIYTLLVDNLSRSTVSKELGTGFEYLWYLQFRYLYETNLSEFPLTIVSVSCIYVIIMTFYSGGIISVFSNGHKNHIVDYFYGGVKYFYRFLRITMISMLFYALAFLFNDYLGEFIRWLFINTEYVVADAVLRSLRYIILVFLIGLISMYSDYTKVNIAVNDNLSIYRGIAESFGFLFLRKNFTRVFVVFLTVAAIGALGAVIYNIIGRLIPKSPFYYLILVFILQQLLIIFRLYIRMYIYSTEVVLYKDLNAEIVKAKVMQ